MNENFLPLQNVLEIANQVIDWWGQKAQQHYIINFVSLSPQFMPNAKLLSFYFLFFPFNLWNSCNPWAETKNKLTNKEKNIPKKPLKIKKRNKTNQTPPKKPHHKTTKKPQTKSTQPFWHMLWSTFWFSPSLFDAAPKLHYSCRICFHVWLNFRAHEMSLSALEYFLVNISSSIYF